MEAKDEQPKAVPQLDPHMLQLAEHERNIYLCTVDAGVTRKDILNPLFWSHIAPKLRPYTRIEARSHDGSLFAELLVTQAERTWAKVHVLSWHDLTTQDVSLTKDDVAAAAKIEAGTGNQYQVVQKGPVKKWCVINTKTNPPAMVREGEPTKRSAEVWLDEYLKVTQ